MLQAVKQILRRKKGANNSVVGVEFTPDGVCMAQIAPSSEKELQLVSLAYEPCEKGAWNSALETLVETHHLANTRCELVFHPDFYNLMLIDAPLVEDDELADAVKWRVKDLIPQDIEEVVVDAFKLPPDAYRGRMNMIYAAIIEKTPILDVIELMENLRLDLQHIGITELSVCNLVRSIKELENQGIALVRLEHDKGHINLTENGALYLTRTLETGLDALSAPPSGPQEGLSLESGSPIDSLALDIQRSLDYYESQIGKSSITRIYLLAHHGELHDIAQQLSAILPAPVEPFNFFQVIHCEDEHLPLLGHCSVAIGAALWHFTGGGDDAVSTTD